MKLSKAEVDAIIAASPRTFVPFNKLVLSEDYQARTGGSTPKLSIAELAASIKESGVLQNLVVVEGARGRYEVCAGGRRLEALALLVSRNDIADNYPVPVLIVPADKALMASLAENCFHVPMHPADEFAAFAKLIGQGKSVEDVAAAFGVTPLVVKRRMKLATVSPKLMALFREDKISLDCLMVLASVDDHEKQEQAWANLPSWNRHADYLRQLLTRGEIESDRHPVAKYVTVKAYEKAGGPSRRDLFSDDDKKVYLLDAALLEKLAIEKLQRQAKQVLAEGWKWVDVRTRYIYDEYVKYGELRKAKRPSTEQEAAELESLQAQIAERHKRMEELADQDGNEDEFYKLEQEAEALGAQVDAIEAALVVWPVELMAQAGCVVYVGDNAAPAVRYGLVRPEDRSDMALAAREAGSTEGAGGESPVSLPAAKTRPVHSERLVRSLTAHRVAVIQAELLSRPDVAIAALTAQLAAKLVLDGYRRLYGSGDSPDHQRHRHPRHPAHRGGGHGSQRRVAAVGGRAPSLGQPAARRRGRDPALGATAEQRHRGPFAHLPDCDQRDGRLWHRTGQAEHRRHRGGARAGHDEMVEGLRAELLQPCLQGAHPGGRDRSGRGECGQPAASAQEGCGRVRSRTGAGGRGVVAGRVAESGAGSCRRGIG